MVAKIISGKSIRAALSYNENKVDQGKAELIWQSGFKKEIEQLSFEDKLSRFQALISRNKRAKTNAVHISLNFAVDERVEETKLNAIAGDYMEHIGFGDQPYLVYLHRDAGHPHIHIVSTNIKHSGERISLHNLGKTKSEEARQMIEKRYGLVQAKRKVEQEIPVRPLARVEYGKDDTKRAISNIVRGVIQSYKFTSLSEFNAVLSCYNVHADRGSPESTMYAKKGLLYWAMDDRGKKVGISIKASSIYSSPTLKKLEQKFVSNKVARRNSKESLKTIINRVIVTKASLDGFKQALSSKNIDVLFRRNSEGRLYGVTFVDHNTRCVFNGSDLGKGYSANVLGQWFTQSQNMAKNHKRDSESVSLIYRTLPVNRVVKTFDMGKNRLLEDLLKTEFDDGLQTHHEMRRKKKKRKRRIQN